nr:sodium:dicarboxylate symporter family [uncultured bacterium]
MIALATGFFDSIGLREVLIGLLLFVVTFAVNLAIVSFILVKLPASYFQESHSREFWTERPPIVRLFAIIGKNLLGVVLVALGVVLSLPGVPGQGLLTILLGIMLLDFPGKRRFELKLVSRPRILNAINNLRHRFGKPALVLD